MTDSDQLTWLSDLLDKAKKAGATEADAILSEGSHATASVRLGEPEHMEQAESASFGLRVLVGKRQAMVSSSDKSPEAVSALVERAISMAKVAPEDPHVSLATDKEFMKDFPIMEMSDGTNLSMERLIALAKETEDAARTVPGITNSDGGSASQSHSTTSLVTSHGFSNTITSSGFSLSASVIAGNGSMETDYAYSSARFFEDLESPEAIGKEAGERTVKRLNPKKLDTSKMSIIFDPRVGKSLIGALSAAINGASIVRGTSFLKDAMGEKLFDSAISIIDDPHLPRGLASCPHDDEGMPGIKRAMIDQGVLTSWFLDLRSASKLGLTTTGHASRDLSSPPSPSSSNLYMEAGSVSPEELMKDIASGFYITEVTGGGTNLITGDYSHGASGFYIDNGTISYPVSEVTIAGHLRDMFQSLTPANDLVFRYSKNVPTIRIDGMTVAGN